MWGLIRLWRLPVARWMARQGFWNPVIQDIRINEYEYRENEVVQGAKYPSIEAVKEPVKLWAISLRKEFRVVKSNRKEYEMKCVNGDCTWRVHAYKSKYKKHWKCSIVTPHTCRLTAVAQNHRNIRISATLSCWTCRLFIGQHSAPYNIAGRIAVL